MGILLKVVGIVPTIIRLVGGLGVINDVKQLADAFLDAVTSTKEFLESLRHDLIGQGKEILKKWDKVTEEAADICKRIPGLKKHEKQLRDLIKNN